MPDAIGSGPEDTGAARGGMDDWGKGRDVLDGFAPRDGPCLMNRARASRYNPDLNEPGGGRRDSSGGRSGNDGGSTEIGSPHWWQKL